MSSCHWRNWSTPQTIPSTNDNFLSLGAPHSCFCLHNLKGLAALSLLYRGYRDSSLSSMRSSLRLLASPAAASRPRTKKPPPLSFDHFIQRQRVLGLWRTILRSLYKIPHDRRAEPVSYARGEFERNKHVKDISQIRYLISTGKAEFDGMRRYIDELASRG